jgi:hypothetical protein
MPQNFVATSLINASIIASINAYPKLQANWVSCSFGFARLNKHIYADVQQLGSIDLLLRQLEDEFGPRIAASSLDFVLADQLRVALSVNWIIGAYEVIRMAFLTDDGRKDDKLKSLYVKFELIRVPLAKRQIALDSKVSAKLTLLRVGDTIDKSVLYSKDSRIDYAPIWEVDTSNGSLCWVVIDAKTSGMVRVSRRDLSDECLRLFQ